MKKIKWILLSAIVLLIFVVCSRDMFFYSPFENTYTFDSVSNMAYGNDGKLYVIDNGKVKISVIDKNGNLVRQIDGGSESDSFYYASEICADENGNIFIADIVYGKAGNRLQKERILMLSGNRLKILYEDDFANDTDPPLQYGNIYHMVFYQEKLYFTRKEEKGLSVYQLGKDGSLEKRHSYNVDFYLSDGAYDPQSDITAVSTRNGRVFYVQGDGQWMEVPSFAAKQIPWDLSVRDGAIYYTDLLNPGILKVQAGTTDRPERIISGETIYYKLAVGDGKLVTTDYGYFGEYDLSDPFAGRAVYESAPIAFYAKVVATWFCAALLAALLVFIVVLLVRKIRLAPESKTYFYQILIVVLSSLSVAGIVSYSTIMTMVDNQIEDELDNLNLFAQTLSLQVDVESLEDIDQVDDYRSERYNRVKAPLDAMIEKGYENGNYYYYIILRPDGDVINCVMDYEDTTTSVQPLYEYGGNVYTEVLETGEQRTVSDEISAYGAWVFTVLPIKNADGETIAGLEVGTNLDRVNAEKDSMIFNNICSVFCSSTVVVMLILEVLFVVMFYERQKGIPVGQRDITESLPIRTAAFITYMADSMQDAFIAILCSRLYADSILAGQSILSEGLAVALPMSAQLFMSALFALMGGQFVKRFGTKNIMLFGFATQALGFVVCCAMGNYEGILLGKILIGTGQGSVYVSANTMAAMGRDDATREKAFADVSAGVQSGVTIGVGLGSIILMFGDFHLVYATGAIALVLGLIMAMKSKQSSLSQTDDETEQMKVGFFRFMFNKRVIPFFLLILMPFMMALSYREYFFPLVADENGIDEVRIGQIYLVCGMIVLYIGPRLAAALLQKLGAKRSVLLASIGMAANMGLYILYPTLASAIAGVVILSCLISFAYTCQYTYFEQLPECKAYGEGNSMGIYSMFENAGQMLGPIIYGMAMAFGRRNGLTIITAGMFVLIGLFVAISARHGGMRCGKRGAGKKDFPKETKEKGIVRK